MSAPLVLVTGATGYVGSWCIAALLTAGYRVRGTVRSLANQNKISFLRNLCPDAKGGPVELVEADLLDSSGWAAAVEGCTYCLHVASPFVIDEPKNPNDLIKPAVEGTLNVLRAVSAMPADKRIKRVVVTSSVAAVSYTNDKPEGHVFSEDDWSSTDPKVNSAYVLSKALAEKAAWDFVAGLSQENTFELATVNPVLVLGPVLGGSVTSGSAELISKLVLGTMPGVPQLPMGIVDVRDVALVHLGAMTHPEAAGKRFIAQGDSLILPDFIPPLISSLGKYKYKIPTFTIPNGLLYTLSFFMKDAANAYKNIRGNFKVVGKNVPGILKHELSADRSMISEHALGLISIGQIKDLSDGNILSTNQPPEVEQARISPVIKGIEKYII